MADHPFLPVTNLDFKKDEELLQAVRDGNEGAIDYLYKCHFQQVKSFILQNSGTPDDAKDVFQDGVVAFWVNIRQGKFQLTGEASLSTYLLRICKNRWLDKTRSAGFRKNASLNALPEPLTEDNALTNLISTDELNRLSVLFGRLGEKCKTILRAFYYEKQSIEEIARTLQMQPASLKNEKYRCMMRLKELYHPTKP